MSELERLVNTLDVRNVDDLREFLGALFTVHAHEVEVELKVERGFTTWSIELTRADQ